MSKLNEASQSLPAAVKTALITLGRNIHIARLRRNLRLKDLAERIGISRYLMSDIEKGKPTAAISAYISALWAMNLIDNLHQIADPNQDTEGKALEEMRLPKIARKHKNKRELDNDF